MKTADEMIFERKIPELLDMGRGKHAKTKEDFEALRPKIKKLLCEYEYGYIPEKPDHLRIELVSEDSGFCAGKAPLKKLRFILSFGEDEFSFPVYEVTPKSENKVPAFVHINFRPDVPDKYLPSEEIADRGFAVFSFCYKDITSDDGNFKNGIARHFIKGRRKLTDPGKIAMWAYAAMRVMDYIETLPYIDTDNVAVIGHSRLGKTALLASAFDERFKYAISNDSGCSGAAISRGKVGESIHIITDVFPFWFCPMYKKFSGNEDKLPFDQHFLLALTVPRHVMIGSAELDLWADPKSEFLSLALINDAYSLYGMDGLIHDGFAPNAKCVLDKGDSLYHIRHGQHYFSREDWNVYMDFIEKQMKCVKN